MQRCLTVVLVCCFLVAGASTAQHRDSELPISLKGLISALRTRGLSSDELVERINRRGVDFYVTVKRERQLRAAGATKAIIDACKSHYEQDFDFSDEGVARTLERLEGTHKPHTTQPTGPGWTLVEKTSQYLFYAAPKTVSAQAKGIVTMLVMRKPVSGQEYDKVVERMCRYIIRSQQFDCDSRSMRDATESTYYLPDDSTIKVTTAENSWELVEYGSAQEALLNYACAAARR